MDKGKITDRDLRQELKGAEYLKEQIGKLMVKVNSRHKQLTDTHRKKIIELCGKYESVEEAHNDYGWGFISEQEFEEIKEHFERGNAALDEVTKWSVAYDYLRHFYIFLCRVVRDLKYELLSPKEKEQYKKNVEEWEKQKTELKKRAKGDIK